MEHRKIFYILNQKSGVANETDIESIIRKHAIDNEIDYELYFLTGNNDEIRIKDKVNIFQPQIVAAAGGDGTINLVASVISGMPLKLAIIPLGSANGLAFELGIPEKTEDALDLILTGEAKPFDIIQINEDHISLHLCDAGINARIVKEFEREGKRGFMSYVRHSLKELTRPQRSYKCSVHIGNSVFTHKAYMTIIANGSRYRTGANVNPGGRPDDGIFEIVILKPYHRWLWRSFTGAFTGTLHEKPNIETYKCTSAVINTVPGQEFQADGESLGKISEIKARIHKHALKIISGEKTDFHISLPL